MTRPDSPVLAYQAYIHRRLMEAYKQVEAEVKAATARFREALPSGGDSATLHLIRDVADRVVFVAKQGVEPFTSQDEPVERYIGRRVGELTQSEKAARVATDLGYVEPGSIAS